MRDDAGNEGRRRGGETGRDENERILEARRAADGVATRTFLVEWYLPAAGPDALGEALARDRRAAEEMTARGTPIRHLRSIYVPDDETCFSPFEAPSAAAVAEAKRLLGDRFQRVVPAVDTPAQA